MKWAIPAVGLLLLWPADQAVGQTYPLNPGRGVVRNPATGQIQQFDFADSPVRGFYGRGSSGFDPLTNSFQRSVVRRNPFTGRLDFQTRYFDPRTGATYQTGSWYDPFTQSRQRAFSFTPPPELPSTTTQATTSPDPPANSQPEDEQQPPTYRDARRGPLVIENKFDADGNLKSSEAREY